MEFLNILKHLIGQGIFLYAVTITMVYLVLAIFSILEMRSYLKKTSFIDYKEILSSPFAPSISMIAPAYNEGLTIIENVRSLLSIQYNNYDVIIVNDGSKDDSMVKMIEYFDLVMVPYYIHEEIKTREVKGVYKSRNLAFKRLTVIDKENGGKADALNVGLNASNSGLVACIDVDCVIEPDALLKMAKPFMDDKDDKVIACGGVVRIANSCVIEDGRLVKVKFPEGWLARFQVVEYLRAFLLSRMAWARLNGLLIISGAFGLFNREIAVQAGGYNTSTVGEDMELVVRMRAYMVKLKRQFKVVYIPDPLCWTEAPDTNQILGRQRNRWARGTVEVLNLHKYMFLNPKYGIMGMLSYPFWFFFEWLAPFVELGGIIYFIFLIFTGSIWWTNFLLLSVLVYVFAVFISMFSLFAEEISYGKYSSKQDLWKIIITVLIEPIIYHPCVTYWSLKGNYDLWKGKSSWGEMTRSGFKKKN